MPNDNAKLTARHIHRPHGDMARQIADCGCGVIQGLTTPLLLCSLVDSERKAKLIPRPCLTRMPLTFHDMLIGAIRRFGNVRLSSTPRLAYA